MTAMFDGKVKQLRLVKLNRGGESYPPLALLDSEGAREREREREIFFCGQTRFAVFLVV